MNRKLAVFALLIATTFFWLPADSNSVSAQEKGKGHNRSNHSRVWQPGKHKGWKNTHGYKNYGQYRRTQVGNRRYHLTKRYYWQDGTRLSRFMRVYY